MDQPSPAPVVAVVANNQRRRICRHLVECHDSTATLGELAGTLGAESRDGRSPSDTLPGSHDRVKIDLHHVHLPKLDDANVVEYHRDRRTVETAAAFPVADRFTRMASDGGLRSEGPDRS